MPKMEIASILLNLAGDRGNTVPKFNVTPSEIAVLRAIHGDDSVSEIDIVGEVERGYRTERQRLAENYGRQVEGKFKSDVVDELFPGAAARMFETVSELEIPDIFFKAERRSPGRAATPKPEAESPTPSDSTSLDEGTDSDGEGIEEIDDEHSDNGGGENQQNSSEQSTGENQQNSSLFG